MRRRKRAKRAKARRPTLVYWNTIPSPYVVERLNALADRGHVDFEAWFNTRTEPIRSWTVDEAAWRFTHRYLPSLRLGRRILAVPTPLLSRRAPRVLICLHGEPSFVLGHILARLRGTKVAIWVLTTYDSWLRRYWWKELLKGLIFRNVDAVLVPGEDAASFATRYGATSQNLHLVDQVVDVAHFAGGAADARKSRARTRRELGIRGIAFLYVGRLWMGKGLRYLFEAFATVERKMPGEVTLLLVGDGPDEQHLRRLKAQLGLESVVFAGFKEQSDLTRYYALGDVLVFPTLGDPYGLVVDEAMACRLPVISTTAAGEIHRRVDRTNGALVAPGDSASLASAMLALAGATELRQKMGRTSFEKVANRTPETWADQIEGVVYKIGEAPYK